MLKFLENKFNNNEEVLISFVGDSITYGLNHCTEEETHVAIITKLFAEYFKDTTVLRYDGLGEREEEPIKAYNGPFTVNEGKCGKLTVVKCGVGGNTVRRAINRADDFKGEFLTGKKPDIYFFMFGINDALKNDPKKYVVPEQFYSDLNELLDIVKKSNPSAKAILMTATYNDSGDKSNSNLEPYCNFTKRIAEERGLFLIDTHKLWMNHLVLGSENHGQRDWLSTVDYDCCHYSPTGAAETAKFTFEEFKKLTL